MIIEEKDTKSSQILFNVWADQDWSEPLIEEEAAPDRTRLTLVFEKTTIKSDDKKAAIKSGDKKAATKLSAKTKDRIIILLDYMKPGQYYKASELEPVLEIKASRLREILKIMVDQKILIAEGEQKSRVYIKANDRDKQIFDLNYSPLCGESG